jgi:hypothetical protein
MGRLRFTTAKRDGSPDDGNYFTFNLYGFEKRWVRHPDREVDLCIMPLEPILNEMRRQSVNLYSAPFNRSHIPTAEILAEMRAVEDIIMIGYPNGLWDKVNNLPIFRKGITATHPRFHYNGREEFLIDAACFPGSSGSPVIHADVGNYVRSGRIFKGDVVMLLGVLYAAPQHTINGDIEMISVPTAQKSMAVSRIPNNLGVVINAGKVLDFDKVIKNGPCELSDFLVFHSAARRRSRSGG